MTTKYLKLLKKDPVTDGSDVFNIETMLNENWDKIDIELEAIAANYLSNTDGGYILQNVWLGTRHTPAGKRVKQEQLSSGVLARCWKSAFESGTTLEARVWRTRSLTVDGNGSLLPGAAEEITVTEGSQALAGWYWSLRDTFSADGVWYTPENESAYVSFSENTGDESEYLLLVSASPVTVEEYAAQTGETEVFYGDPGAYPASGYGENPAAAPYEGYLYQALGPFKHLPFYAGSGGGNVTVLAPDTVLYVPQTLTEAQQAQARANIGAAAVGMGGMDTDKIVAAVLAALPIAEEAAY